MPDLTAYTITPEMLATPLASGSHDTRGDGVCLMEWLAWVAGEEHTDHPQCVSPVLGVFGRGLNDVLPRAARQRLKTVGLAALGTAGDGLDETRSYMALDWLVRTWLPAWLDLVPSCREAAVRVRDLGRIVDVVSADRAGLVVREAREQATAAWDAARAAAWAAARDADRDAAWDAAWAAARDAAWAVAWAADRDAAWAAAWAVAWAADRDAAWAVARAPLAPTVTALQQSAIDLYARMIRPDREETPDA
ncbi:hypothetical protein ACFQE5_22115 [Pseudonocardia hispaniensis]|uniref:Uncharacterized protein n=1 Tax=Pseudonocardia hispaniensis TaxID=904933 RepID=A0ABW1J8P4_9PSEU